MSNTLLIGLVVGGAAVIVVIYFWNKFIQPFVKKEINIVITGTADELDALAEAIRSHQLQAQRNKAKARRS